MPPQTEQTPDPTIQQPELQQPPKRPSKRKLYAIVAVVVVLLVGVAIVRANNANKNRDADKNPTTDSSIYNFRPGYDVKEYGSSIGDPLALSMAKLDSARKSSKGLAVFACNVVTIDELNAQKIYLSARADDKAVTRNFIDGVGTQAVKIDPYYVNEGDKADSCDYSLESGGLVTIKVYQPPFTTTSAIKDFISRRYTKIASAGGLATYKEKDDDRSAKEFILRSGIDATSVLFNGTKLTDDQQRAVLNIAAKNFVDQQKHGKGPAIPAYNTPTYKKKWARACDFITNGDIKSLTGHNASIYATEGLASGTGVEKANDTLYNSITTSCSRFNTDVGSPLIKGPFDQKLEVQITSYNEDTPAKIGLQDIRTKVPDAVTANVGDEGIIYKDSTNQNTLLFRQGRFIIQIVFDRVAQDNAGLSDTHAMLKKLTPYAANVATRLKALN